jgi:hypothetical protein
MKARLIALALPIVACSSAPRAEPARAPTVAVAESAPVDMAYAAQVMAATKGKYDDDCDPATAITADTCGEGLYCATGLGCKKNLSRCRSTNPYAVPPEP